MFLQELVDRWTHYDAVHRALGQAEAPGKSGEARCTSHLSLRLEETCTGLSRHKHRMIKLTRLWVSCQLVSERLARRGRFGGHFADCEATRPFPRYSTQATLTRCSHRISLCFTVCSESISMEVEYVVHVAIAASPL